MDKRIKLGLIFSLNERWIGGTYYILNLISALKTLPTEKQPQIIILSNNVNDFKIAQQTNYPFLEFKNPFLSKRNLVEKVIDKINKIIFGKYIIDKSLSQKDVDVIFPANNDNVYKKITNKIYWFADFQHIALPQYFSEDELHNLGAVLQEIGKSQHHLILSSQNAKSYWDKIIIDKNCKVSVIPFAVTHPNIDDEDIKELLIEFNISEPYYIVSNQFWAHKNHIVVLKAILILLQNKNNFQFIFTGKGDDYRNEGFFKTILSFIDENGLNPHVKILGLIDRKKQLKLMQHSLAVIQPSLFEGWSSVIEDAKALRCKIIASNIAVHYEQLGNNGIFFDKNSENDLADKILHNSNKKGLIEIPYTENVKTFASKFLDVIENSIHVA